MRLIDAHSLVYKVENIREYHEFDGIEYVRLDDVLRAINNVPTISIERSEDSDPIKQTIKEAEMAYDYYKSIGEYAIADAFSGVEVLLRRKLHETD